MAPEHAASRNEEALEIEAAIPPDVQRLVASIRTCTL